MKNIYLVVFTLLMSISISFGQSRVYAPELQSPENGVDGQMPAVELNWHAVTGSGLDIQYEVQLSIDEAFSDPIKFPLTNVTAINASDLKFGTTYFWRVRAHDGSEVSDWSEIWSFDVLKTVEVTQPSDGSVVNPKVDMKWEMIEGVNFYEVLVDTLYSWKREDIGTDNSVRATFVLNANVYGGVGDDGLVFFYDGEWMLGESGTTKDLLGVYFVADDNGWAVGKSGTVIHYDGTAWSTVDAGTGDDLNSVSFTDANNGWAVGKGGTVLYYNGTDWTEQDAGVTKDLYSVFAVSATDVWAAGKSGTMVHFDGSAWSSETPSSKDINSLWFISATDGWASAKSGRVLHYDGSAWSETETGVSKTLYGIAFSGEQGYIVGQSGTLLEYDGSAWNKVTSGTNKDLYAIWFTDGAGLYGGKEGAAYTYTGGGFNSPYATIHKVDGNIDSLYLQNLYFGSTYYYKMRTGHNQDTSTWSLPRSFKVQSSPVLKSPKDDAADVELKAELEWKEFKGISKYNVQIADNPEFNNSLTYASETNTYEVAGLSFGIKYYWRVNAQHAKASSLWSEVWTFTTINSVNLVSPEDGAVNVNACPRLIWEEVPGASKYELWVDTDENFSNPMMRIETIPSSQCQAQMEKNTDYYWKVRGIVALDTSGWSPIWKFTIEGPEAIDEIIESNSVTLFPNPSNGAFTVQLNASKSEEVYVELIDISGRVVYNDVVSCSVGKNNIAIDLNELPVGVYQVNLKVENNVISRKLIIE
jgi:hypothetical protein